MNWIDLLGISIGLAMDAFAVAIAIGVSRRQVTPRHVFRVSFHFGLFQALMPLIGWYVGRSFAVYIQCVDHWIAFGLLTLIGGRMLWESYRESDEKDADDSSTNDPTRGWTLIALSFATSIDALAVGVSMAFLGVDIWLPAIVIGVVAATLSCLGISFGSRLGGRWERGANIVGGLVLIAIGLRILVNDLWFG